MTISLDLVVQNRDARMAGWSKAGVMASKDAREMCNVALELTLRYLSINLTSSCNTCARLFQRDQEF